MRVLCEAVAVVQLCLVYRCLVAKELTDTVLVGLRALMLCTGMLCIRQRIATRPWRMRGNSATGLQAVD